MLRDGSASRQSSIQSTKKTERTKFPILAAVPLFLLFGAFYIFVTWTAVEPRYLTALCLSVPCFGLVAVACLNIRGKASADVSAVLSVLLIAMFFLGGFGLLIYLAMDAATTTTTDVSKYQRVLRISSLPLEFGCDTFPQAIPDGADEVHFSYHPAFMMGGEELVLQFKMSDESAEAYQKKFEAQATWTGNGPNAYSEDYGIFMGTLSPFDLPADTVVYAISATPSKVNDWNHGKRFLTAVSDSENSVLFYAERW